jgi:hypothetical protein
VVGVGHKLVDELLAFPSGGNPEIEAAIEEFMQHKQELEEVRLGAEAAGSARVHCVHHACSCVCAWVCAQRVRELEGKAAAGGVKGLAAAQELAILTAGKDDTELNRIELTLQVSTVRRRCRWICCVRAALVRTTQLPDPATGKSRPAQPPIDACGRHSGGAAQSAQGGAQLRGSRAGHEVRTLTLSFTITITITPNPAPTLTLTHTVSITITSNPAPTLTLTHTVGISFT